MESHIISIRSIDKITHDVLRIRTEKPDGYDFTPGQATEVAIYKEGWMDKKRPFTFTSLASQDFLEFTVKTYPARNGVTAELLSLRKGDELVIHDVWGSISYQGTGYFIAGGAGITPFLSILRTLHAAGQIGSNILIFANKARHDIICEDELRLMLGPRFINILSEEKVVGIDHGFITKEYLKEIITDPEKKIYICGPPPMMDTIQKHLAALSVGENAIVMEI